MNPSSSKPLADNWCQSVCDLVTVDIEWNIQQLGLLESDESWIPSLQSSFFSPKNMASYEWNLELRDDTRDIKILLNLREKGKPDLSNRRTNYPVRVTMVILNKNRQRCHQQAHVYPARTSFPQFVYSLGKRTMLGCLQMDNSIIIHCEVQTLIYKSIESGFKANGFGKQQPFIDGDQLLRSQLEELFESKMLNDVTLDVDNRHFQAHKSILASKSKVFAAMFAHETKEKLSNHVKVEDIKADVFQEVLRFIYTGRLPLKTMDQMATDLLVAAEKYLLDQLKIECENHLLHRMTPDNCLDLISLTDQHHPASHLKKFAVDYFRRFPTKVMATDGWMQAKQDNAAWLCDILQMALSPAE